MELNRIGPPQPYQVYVYTKYNGIGIDDVTPFLTPKPKFDIYMPPLKIEPAALKLVELRIQSNTMLRNQSLNLMLNQRKVLIYNNTTK